MFKLMLAGAKMGLKDSLRSSGVILACAVGVPLLFAAAMTIINFLFPADNLTGLKLALLLPVMALLFAAAVTPFILLRERWKAQPNNKRRAPSE